MAVRLGNEAFREFRNELKHRLARRREEVRQVLLRSDNESYQTLAGGVHDIADQSLADLLVDINLAEVDRHIEEIRAIEAALLRVARHEFGVCADCGEIIERSRLRAEPTSLRCAECQANYERSYAQPAHPKL